jgi:hypothetical protein
MGFFKTLAVHSPIISALSVAAIGVFYPLPNTKVQPLDTISSPPFLACLALLFGGWILAASKGLYSKPAIEQTITLWHLSNAAWWFLACDVLSGFFGIMPRFSDAYVVLDPRHALTNPEDRLAIDGTYWCEALIHIPSAWIVFFLIIYNHPGRQPVEMFASGVQLAGTVIYYVPELAAGGNHYCEDKVVYFTGVVFGLVWFFVPLLLVVRAFRQLQAIAADNVDAAPTRTAKKLV